MHALANPARFLRMARPATAWLMAVGLLLTAAGMAGGLTLTPPDYLQGETVRILYVHVPAAWLGMAGWAGIAAASISQLVWRHPLSAIAGRAIAPAGATFALVCLATGSIWGRPTWGTWWEWDGRLTSMLILFFLYLGYLALVTVFNGGLLTFAKLPMRRRARPSPSATGTTSSPSERPSRTSAYSWERGVLTITPAALPRFT